MSASLFNRRRHVTGTLLLTKRGADILPAHVTFTSLPRGYHVRHHEDHRRHLLVHLVHLCSDLPVHQRRRRRPLPVPAVRMHAELHLRPVMRRMPSRSPLATARRPRVSTPIATIMPIALRHSRDPVPSIPRPADWSVRDTTDIHLLAALHARDASTMQERLEAGHRAYVAYVGSTAAAFGWVATREATIGELGFGFRIAPHERYLWNFVTLPAFRGRGLYPRLLDDIVRHERMFAQHFWIAYAPENHASGRGIRRAGFVDLAALSFLENGHPALSDMLPGGASRARALLGIGTTPAPLAPCWRCVRAGRAHSCAAGACACDYQQPLSGCAAEAQP